ncbi:hypothetical protein D3C80_1774990 [compost metagenome]
MLHQPLNITGIFIEAQMHIAEMNKPRSGKSRRQLPKLQLQLCHLKPVRLSLPDIPACKQPRPE